MYRKLIPWAWPTWILARSSMLSSMYDISLDRQDIESLINQFSPSRREEYGVGESDPGKASGRGRLIEKVSDTLIDLRMLAKTLNKGGIKAPLVMEEMKPVSVEFVEVEQFPDESS